jgi:hypothetical protein
MYHHQLFKLLAFLCCILGCALCVLGVIAQQLPADAVRYSISGSGSGGAYGPSIVHSFSDLPSPSAQDEAGAAQRGLLMESLAEKQAGVLSRANQAVIPPRSRQVQSSDSEFIEGGDSPSSSNAAAATAAATVSNGFSETTTVDVTGATNGSVILVYNGAGVLVVHTMTGTVVKQTQDTAFWCSGTDPLPVCGTGGFAVDPRVKYDTRSQRWIVTGLWLFGSNSVAQDVLAVSQTSDPTQGWNLYQFPACGAFDNWDGSDQPHTGFNGKWIVVSSACSSSSGVNGAGLAVFAKSNLYAGGALTLNQNWFEFVDPFSGGPYSGIGGGDGTREHPVTTYTSGGREYLVTSTNNTPFNTGNAGVIYSYVTGPTDAPTFSSAALTVNTSFSAIDISGVGVDAPGCMNCISAFSNNWIHSAGVWNWKDGFPRVVSTMVMGKPGYARGATQVISVAMKIADGTSTALRISKNAAGSGPLASEIGVPLGGISMTNEALIAYDYSNSGFYPGIKMATWNLDNNSIISTSVLKEGILTPNNGDQNRWTDFMDALSPIPGTGSFVVGGTVARPTPNDDPQRKTFYATVTP